MGSEVSIGDVVTLSQGFAVNSKSKHLMASSGLPLLRITDLINNTESQYLTPETAPEKCIAGKDDLIFTRTGQVGLVFRGRTGVIHNNCFKVMPDESLLDKGFLYWFLKQPQIIKLANSIASGSVQKDLNHSAFKTIKISLLPLEEQKKCAAVMDSIEDKITLNRQINQTLEQMAQTLFKSWFVDFDPVIDNALDAGNAIPDELQARAEQRQALRHAVDEANKANAENLPHSTHSNSAAGDALASTYKPLPDDIRQLFPNEFEESELGWVPKGWVIKKVSDIANINANSWTKKNQPEFVDYVDLSNTKHGVILDTEVYPFDQAPSRARRILAKKDTIFGLVRPANRSYAFVDKDGLTGSTGFAVLTSKKSNTVSFIYQLITSDKTVDDFIRIADGAAYPAIKPEDIAVVSFPMPNQNILDRFELIVDSYRDKSAQGLSNNSVLTQLRDTLLPKLISGELRLDEVESTIAETTTA